MALFDFLRAKNELCEVSRGVVSDNVLIHQPPITGLSRSNSASAFLVYWRRMFATWPYQANIALLPASGTSNKLLREFLQSQSEVKIETIPAHEALPSRIAGKLQRSLSRDACNSVFAKALAQTGSRWQADVTELMWRREATSLVRVRVNNDDPYGTTTLLWLQNIGLARPETVRAISFAIRQYDCESNKPPTLQMARRRLADEIQRLIREPQSAEL